MCSMMSAGAFAMTKSEKDSIPPVAARDRALLERYGTDDTVQALVHFYRVKRKRSLITTAPFLVVSTVTGIAFDRSNRDQADPNAPDWGGTAYTGLFYFLVLLTIVPITLVLFINSFRFNQKQLRKRLQAYQSGKPVSKWIRDSRIFRKKLEEIKNDE